MASLKSYGEWALVTGASAGIGTAFARRLAAQGVNVVLVARRADRLEALAAELRDKHGVRTRVVPEDLEREGVAERLVEWARDLEIGILVNNAGFSTVGRFERVPRENILGMIRVNCLAVAALTHAFLPAMQARRRGARRHRILGGRLPAARLRGHLRRDEGLRPDAGRGAVGGESEHGGRRARALAGAGRDRIPGGRRGETTSGRHAGERGRDGARRARQEAVGHRGRDQQGAHLVASSRAAQAGGAARDGRDAGLHPGGPALVSASWDRARNFA